MVIRVERPIYGLPLRRDCLDDDDEKVETTERRHDVSLVIIRLCLLVHSFLPDSRFLIPDSGLGPEHGVEHETRLERVWGAASAAGRVLLVGDCLDASYLNAVDVGRIVERAAKRGSLAVPVAGLPHLLASAERRIADAKPVRSGPLRPAPLRSAPLLKSGFPSPSLGMSKPRNHATTKTVPFEVGPFADEEDTRTSKSLLTLSQS